MRLHILAVGNKQPFWITSGCNEYIMRMPRDFTLQLTFLKPEPRSSNKTVEQIIDIEKRRIEERLANIANYRLIALDERGKDLTTMTMSQKLEHFNQERGDLVFLIGGADGLSAKLKEKANALWRLSSLTLPHGLVCLLLCEQLYRAVSIIKLHPYHRQ